MTEEVIAAPVVSQDLPVESEPTQEASVVSQDLPVESEPTPEDSADQPLMDDKEQEKRAQSKNENKVARLNRKLEQERAKAEMLQRQIEELKPKALTPQEKMPSLEDFDFDIEKYADAKAKFQLDQTLKQQREEQEAKAQQQTQQKIRTEWESKVIKAEDKYSDFYEKVGDLTPTNPVNIAIMQADNGEEIAYYLANNIEEAKSLLNLDPVSAVRAIGKLEAKLLAEPVKAQQPSNAPEPIKPVKGSGGLNKTIFEAETQEEFEKLRRAQIKRR